jgi:hypothetical protein
MVTKQDCQFERRRCAREASASAEWRIPSAGSGQALLFAGAQIDGDAHSMRRRENPGSVSATGKQHVFRLRGIVRFTNDPAALGMTGLRERVGVTGLRQRTRKQCRQGAD